MKKLFPLLFLLASCTFDNQQCAENCFGSSQWSDGARTYQFDINSDTVNVFFMGGYVKGIYQFNSTCDSLSLSNLTMTTTTTYHVERITNNVVRLTYPPSNITNLIRQ